jgi:hypothetical protein
MFWTLDAGTVADAVDDAVTVVPDRATRSPARIAIFSVM